MEDSIYRELAAHLDKLPGGFPPTASGVEMRILRRLFAPDEAELALHVTLIPEEARVVARRAGIPVEEAERRLNALARKGLIVSLHPEDGPAQYSAAWFAVGFYEYQVATLDEELARDADEYMSSIPPEKWQQAPQMRTIPIGESIPTASHVTPCEDAACFIREQKHIRLSPCICRKKESLLGKGCDKPLETCMAFGDAAEYYARNGIGRDVGVDEALAVLRQAEEAGLVLQSRNSKQVDFLCCCCGDCCEVLKIAKRHPRPATVLVSPFYAHVIPDDCSACGDCLARCQMDAIHVNGHAVVDLDRCIGCGLCVTTCPDEAVHLIRKSDAEQPIIPETRTDLYITMLRNRHQINSVGLVGMALRSKMDRLLAPR